MLRIVLKIEIPNLRGLNKTLEQIVNRFVDNRNT